MKKFLDLLKAATPETLNMSLNNCHADGLFSLVIGGNQNGNLTRAFIAKKEVKPFDIALHTRCYDSTVTFIKGPVKFHTATIRKLGESRGVFLPCVSLNGRDSRINEYFLDDFLVPPHGVIALSARDISTISCNKGAIWIEEVEGIKPDLKNLFLSPTSKTEKLYTTPDRVDILSNKTYLKQLLEKLTKD